MQIRALTAASVAPAGLFGSTGSAIPVRHSLSKLEGSAGRLQSRVSVEKKPSSTPPRASFESLRDQVHTTLSGVPKDLGESSLVVVQKALFSSPSVAAPAGTARSLANHTAAQQLNPTQSVDLASVALKQHASEPAGTAHSTHTVQEHPDAQIDAWTRTVQNAGFEAQGRKIPLFRATDFASAGVGTLSQTQHFGQNQLGQTAMQSSAELGASVKSGGSVSADQSGLALQAGAHARAALTTSSAASWRAPQADIDVVGIRVDMTPSAAVSGRTSMGVDGGASVFAGVSVPTQEGLRAGLVATSSIFIGAKADADASIGIGGNKIGMTGGVWAGAGAQATASGSVSQVNGQTRADVEVRMGAALGVGFMLGMMAQINVQPMVDAAQAILSLGGAVKDGPTST